MQEYYPEGELITRDENRKAVQSIHSLEECALSGRIIEAPCIICDSHHNLIVDFGFMKGIIPRIEGAVGIDDGSTRDIALISRVNKAVCFKVTALAKDECGKRVAILSRKQAQYECYRSYIEKLIPGDIIPAKVTHFEQFGCFLDIGCGIPSFVPIDSISVSRISHPSDRFFIGQKIKTVVKAIEGRKVSLSHKELLGTWSENADFFSVGETVTGFIRSIENYGIFVELTPNLAGLAEFKDNVMVNQQTSVYIKAIIPDKMKIKLVIVDSFNSGFSAPTFKYFIEERHIDCWEYSTPGSDKIIKTVF